MAHAATRVMAGLRESRCNRGSLRAAAPLPTRMRPSGEMSVIDPVLTQVSNASGTPLARR